MTTTCAVPVLHSSTSTHGACRQTRCSAAGAPAQQRSRCECRSSNHGALTAATTARSQRLLVHPLLEEVEGTLRLGVGHLFIKGRHGVLGGERQGRSSVGGWAWQGRRHSMRVLAAPGCASSPRLWRSTTTTQSALPAFMFPPVTTRLLTMWPAPRTEAKVSPSCSTVQPPTCIEERSRRLELGAAAGAAGAAAAARGSAATSSRSSRASARPLLPLLPRAPARCLSARRASGRAASRGGPAHGSSCACR